MNDITAALMVVTSLFVVFLTAKNTVAKKFKYCTICLAVSATWLLLLGLSQFDVFENDLVLGILMGQSSLGVYYLLEKRVSRDLLVFRLPALLTLSLVAYTAIAETFVLSAWSLVASVWLVVSLFYIYRTKPKIRDKVKAMIECCSDW